MTSVARCGVDRAFWMVGVCCVCERKRESERERACTQRWIVSSVKGGFARAYYTWSMLSMLKPGLGGDVGPLYTTGLSGSVGCAWSCYRGGQVTEGTVLSWFSLDLSQFSVQDL